MASVNPGLQPILLVEDNEDDYMATLRGLKKAELHNPLVWCRSGQDALDFLNGAGAYAGKAPEKPGMILLDLNMPGLDGRQTLQIIKDDPELRYMPVIILTTSADEHDIDKCYRIGANSYIQKPVSFDGLITALKRLKEYWFEIALLPKRDSLSLAS